MKFDDFLREVEATWGLLSTDDVLKILGLPVDEPTLLRDLRKRGQLLAVDRGLDFLYPGFQFRAESGVVEPVIVDLIKLASEVHWDLDDLVIWLCSPSGYFGGGRPVEHLNDADELLKKARDAATVQW